MVRTRLTRVSTPILTRSKRTAVVLVRRVIMRRLNPACGQGLNDNRLAATSKIVAKRFGKTLEIAVVVCPTHFVAVKQLGPDLSI